MTLKDGIINSMESIRVEHELTQEQMATKLGMSTSTYKRIVGRKTDSIDIAVVDAVYRQFHVNLYNPDGLCSKISKLSTRQIRAVEAMIDFELQYSGCASDSLIVYVPTGNLEDGMIYDSSSYETMSIDNHHYPDHIFCGIKITSNHLHPAYIKDDILLLSKSTIRDGDIGIFLNKKTGRVYIRKFLQQNPVVLAPICTFGEPILINPHDKVQMDEWHKFGKVIAKVRI